MSVSDRWRSGFVVSGIVLFVAVTFGPALVGQGMLLDTGWLRRMMPYAADGSIPPGTLWCRGDTWDYYLPGMAATVEGVRHGIWPTWAPYEVGGTPLGSLPNHSMLSPVSWPYWVMPLWLAPAWAKLTELVIVLVGMVLFLGRLGVRRSAALIAGLVFFTCGFMMMWTNWPHTKVGCLIPVLFWALDRAVHERGPRDIAAVGLVVAAMLFGGFPAVTMFALTLGAVYVAVRAVGLRDVRLILGAGAAAAGGVLLGVALSAVQILPFVLNLGVMGAETRLPNEAKDASLMLTILAGDAYGTCVDMKWSAEGNAIESISYLGIGAFVLALVALAVGRRGGRRPAVPILLGLCFAAVGWLIWVGGLPLDLLQKVPGYDINSFNRANSIFGFLGAALAGIGLERLMQRSESDEAPRRAPRQRFVTVVSIAVAVAAVAYGAQATYAHLRTVDGGIPWLGRSVVIAGILLAIALAAVAATYWLPARLRFLGPATIALAVLAQSTLFAHQVLPLTDRSLFYPVTPAHEFLKDNLGEERYGAAGWGPSAVTDFYKLRTPTGHEFTTPEWKNLLTAVSPATIQSPTYSDFPVNVPAPGRNRVLDQLSVRYWVTPSRKVLGAADPLPGPPGSLTDLRVPPGERIRCQVSPGTIRGIQVKTHDRLGPGPRTPTTAHVRVGTGSAQVSGVRAITTPLSAGARFRIAVPERRFSGGPVPIEVWFTGNAKPISLAGIGGEASCSAIRPEPRDGLRVVHSSAGSVVYERSTALPRIRWAGTSEVVPDPPTRVARLARDVDADTVLLDDDSSPAAAGSSADVRVIRDAPGTISTQVDATGSGYLLVADSIARPGWSATVDGREVPIVPGNHAFAAVSVPDGTHAVTLRYDAPGLRAGVAISAGGVLVLIVLLIVPSVFQRWRRGRTSSVDPSDTNT